MIAKLLRLIGQVVRVNTDAVAAYQSRLELQEVPLGSCRLQHGFCIDTHLVKNDGQFVHKCNVDVSLAVLDDLGSFCHLDGVCTVNACFHHKLINLCNSIQSLLIHTGYDLGDGLQSVYLVTGVDPFRRVADLKVHTALKA